MLIKNLSSKLALLILLVSFVFFQPLVSAEIDIEMLLNNGGFVSFDHFKAELYLNNQEAVVPDAEIFGILEIYGEYYFWPTFTTEVNSQTFYINSGETYLTFLEFDFHNIDDIIPFGPMYFWGAWFVDMAQFGFDVKEFWLGSEHKWTPTPSPATCTPTTPPGSPTYTPTSTPTSTPTNTPFANPGALYSTDAIVGNMRCVPAGSFTQGSPGEEPCRDSIESQFTHILTKNIAVMETEVSRQMWEDLRAVQPTLPEDPSSTSASPLMINPVQYNTWFEAVLFANLLSLQNGYTQCYYKDATFTIPLDATNYTTGQFFWNPAVDGYRLPSEGEWEHFCRAGTNGPFSCDEPDYTSDTCGYPYCVIEEFPVLEDYAVFCANNPGSTQAVGSKLSNPWNLKDVHGNVYEWCWDDFTSYPSGTVIDYSGPGTSSFRALRGGSWYNRARFCRSANRDHYSPGYRLTYDGFRLVRSVLD